MWTLVAGWEHLRSPEHRRRNTLGALVACLKMDNAFPANFDIATKKAKTVAGFNGAYTTAALYIWTQPGAPLIWRPRNKWWVDRLCRGAAYLRGRLLRWRCWCESGARMIWTFKWL